MARAFKRLLDENSKQQKYIQDLHLTNPYDDKKRIKDTKGKALLKDINAWVALSKIFANILQDPNLNNIYLIINALNKYAIDLLKLLNFIIEKSISSRVKWIVSSRNWPDIKKRLERAGYKVRLCFELNAESISTAVSTYIRHKVDHLAQQNDYGPEMRQTVFNYLSLHANDTFLWVALIWNSDDADHCKGVLATIALVYQPITLKELTSLIEIPDMSIDELKEIVLLCGSFLTIREGTGAIYFVHQSAKDFLFKESFDKIFPTLRRDIYSLNALGYSIEEVKQPELDPLGASRCSYYNVNLQDEGAIHEFIRKKYLYWLEALSLCESIPGGIVLIKKLKALI
ncbi:hypothetical protein AOQ84DRAFT_395764 [Glonium stellatum]|uniref:Uncharacterized protein n=1 Tax=Glonium stellatum TaxID=574774 RepID=A0A8E2F908_9PEZI|nr:hypothetical protein AOQ84DRAFT_395764 [Glonium stellatum]